MAKARGKYAKAISDRSGLEFPYLEMVKEWNGSLVHKSEYDPKHPQIRRRSHKSDAIALQNPRVQEKEDVDKFIIYVNNGFNNNSMLPSASDNIIGTQLESFEMTSSIGEVTISIS
mgnify:FL=1|tara:strand:- start:11465 stop:11812 length:348 start_codon:yes stop_codon:yes gene_type:complete